MREEYEIRLAETAERCAHRGEYNDLAKTVRHQHHDDVLAGCGKTIVARGEKFNGPRVWGNGRMPCRMLKQFVQQGRSE